MHNGTIVRYQQSLLYSRTDQEGSTEHGGISEAQPVGDIPTEETRTGE